ncbi:MAG: RluA family pseudouridine synthase [Akkermansiaceae bacterium]
MVSKAREGVIAVQEHFSVVDEGDGWIMLNKGAPLIVHPANDRGDEPTLLGGVENLLSYEIANGARLSIINRLDRETSGLVLMATNKGVARELGRSMERREVEKGYDALVWGFPEWDEKVVDAAILRKGDVEESRIYVKQMVHEGGKRCVTGMRVVRRLIVGGKKMSLLRVSPHTGRMHQIRVHAEYVGHPIVGDKIYGVEEVYLKFIEDGMSDEMLRELVLPRHALHASRMKLSMGGRECEWCVDLASDIEGLISGAGSVGMVV